MPHAFTDLTPECFAKFRAEIPKAEPSLQKWVALHEDQVWTFANTLEEATEMHSEKLTQLTAFFAIYGLCRILESMQHKDASATDAQR